MLEDEEFQCVEEFIEWWEEQGTDDNVDMCEVSEIYFNQETYDTGVI